MRRAFTLSTICARVVYAAALEGESCRPGVGGDCANPTGRVSVSRLREIRNAEARSVRGLHPRRAARQHREKHRTERRRERGSRQRTRQAATYSPLEGWQAYLLMSWPLCQDKARIGEGGRLPRCRASDCARAARRGCAARSAAAARAAAY